MDKSADTLEHGFKVYRLQKKFSESIPAHFHVFHKIIFLRQGESEAIIEGKKYSVGERDVIFISAGDVHKPILQPDILYDCTILCVKPQFLERYHRNEDDLAKCFNSSVVMRLMTNFSPLLEKLDSLTKNDLQTGFADELYREIFFLECMILINRGIFTKSIANVQKGHGDSNIISLIEFINANLEENLTIEGLAKKFFFSRYYIMHKFKSEMGVSINKYIIIRRIFLASSLLPKNFSIKEVCYKCGFRDYSFFSRVFKIVFQRQPRDYRDEWRKISKRI